MLCEGLGPSEVKSSSAASSALLLNASRLLKPGGKLVLVSLHPPLLLSKLFDFDDSGFASVSIQIVSSQSMPPNPAASTDVLNKGEFSLLVAVRSDKTWPNICVDTNGVVELQRSLCVYHSKVLDDWFTKQCPLLTFDRSVALHQKWKHGIKQANGSTSLALPEAYGVMFTQEEQSEYTYEYFLEDIAEFSGEMSSNTLLTLQEAQKFLAVNQ
mmetsp:Transcript_10642/g.12923  ORF Transcript_10642/g.12923 Transcript_10642/m.12923 type:complete len:213 (-) Transcript_10642:130-768(-)